MADISKIKDLEGTEYTLKARALSTARTIDGVDFNGTGAITHYGICSTAKGTAAKVVDIDGFKLVTGAVVWVRFTVTNSAAVGNLTLNVNGTGAKHIKYRGANLGSVGYLAAGRTYPFVYDGTYWELAGDIDTTTNIGNTIRANCAVVKVGSTAIDSGEIMVAGTDGLYIPLNSGNAFDIKRPIFNEGTATDAGGTSTNNYYATTVAVSKTQDMTLTPQEPIYIKGHLSDTTFTPVSTTPLTQTEPTTADGYQYMFLGVAYSETSFWLSYDHPVYEYVSGVFSLLGTKKVQVIGDADLATIGMSAQNDRQSLRTYASDASSIGTYIDSNGIHVYAIDSKGDTDHFITGIIIYTSVVAANGTSKTTHTIPQNLKYAERRLVATCNGGATNGRNIVSAIPTSATTVEVNWSGNLPSSGNVFVTFMY